MSLGLKSEIIKTLSFIIPALREIYGSHWEEAMDILGSVLRSTNGGEDGLPLLVSSFRLFAQLKAISESDSNDDVQDAWLDRKVNLFNALASTIGTFGKIDPSGQVYVSNRMQTLQLHSINLGMSPWTCYDD